MKFQMLPLGARFEFDARVYIKTGPLTASTEAGQQRMIPRSALLKVLDATVATTPQASRKLEQKVVLEAFEVFFADCARLLHSAESDTQRATALRAELDAARLRFQSDLAASPQLPDGG